MRGSTLLSVTSCKWWKDREDKLTLLSLVALAILAIPASTANVERLFSAAGRAINRRRPQLQRKPVSYMLFGHANIVRGVSPEVGNAFAPVGGLSPLEVQIIQAHS